MGQELKIYKHAGKLFHRRIEDGYFNATQMCKQHGKQWNDYSRLSSTKAFIDELSSSTGIPVNELYQSVSGEKGGTWVHPQVAIDLAQWISPKFKVAVNKWVTEKILGIDARRAELRGASIEQRKAYVDVLQEHGCEAGADIAIATNKGYIGYKQKSAQAWKQELGLPEKASLRDNLSGQDLAAVFIYEGIAAARIEADDLYGVQDCGDETHSAARETRQFIEQAKQPRRLRK